MMTIAYLRGASDYILLQNKSLQNVLTSCWQKCIEKGSLTHRLSSKLERVKDKTVEWSKINYGNFNLKIRQVIKEINNLTTSDQVIRLKSEEWRRFLILKARLHNLLKDKESFPRTACRKKVVAIWINKLKIFPCQY